MNASRLSQDTVPPRVRKTVLYVVWKAYQRRAEVLSPLLDAELICLPHLARARFARPFDYASKFVKTFRHLNERRPGCVFVQAPPHFAALPCLLADVPYVIDAHNALFQSYWGRLPLTRLVMERADAVVVHNTEILNIARSQYPSVRFYVVSDPIVEIRSSDTVGRVPGRVLFICSFDRDEPVEAIIETIESLPDYDFIITADVEKLPGHLRRRLLRCTHVRLTGFVSTEEYHALLCSSEVAISLTTKEATQQCGACEALSSDTPLIVSKDPLSIDQFGAWATLVDNTAESLIRAIRHARPESLDLVEQRRRWKVSVERSIDILRQDLDLDTRRAPFRRVPAMGGRA